MRRLAAALGLIAISAAPASADKWSQERQNLVDLAVAPDDNIGSTRRVFCPIEIAVVGHVVCHMYSQTGDPIGNEVVSVKGVSASEYTKILNNCAGEIGPAVKDGCSFEVDVVVKGPKGNATLQAIKFYPAQ